MNKIERIHLDDSRRENIHCIEKHTVIEGIPACIESKIVFKDPKDNPNLLDETTVIGEKYKKAKEITKDAFLIDAIKKPKAKKGKKIAKSK